MKPSTKKLLSFAFLLFTLGLVLYIGLQENDITELWHAIGNLSRPALLLCLLCWALYVVTDGLSVYYFLKRQGYPITFWQSLYIGVVGIYYSAVTPGASGGQPVQIYNLRKIGVPIGISGSALTVKFFCFQLMLLIVGAILWISQGAYIAQEAGHLVWVVLLGYFFNFLSIGMVLTMAISKRAVRTIIMLVIRIGVKLGICKDPAKSTAKWEAHCDSFLSSVQLIRSNPKDLVIQFLIALAQLFTLMMVTSVIYYAFGLSGTSLIRQITMGVLLYISASYTPLPGASGAQEVGFAKFFEGIFPSAYLFVALLIWRFFTCYLSILVGFLLTTGQSVGGLFHKNHSAASLEAAPSASSTNEPLQQEGASNQDNPL
ncbi:MAG: lysylphosphatidylglycerol synthase transmembrane domain-containing protein [Candidatus Limiplasma sp.]|nr:lysylphosphatidylglycerol synthase transmembrane domain-containing protein [Candidatus Limiplasma sp.]